MDQTVAGIRHASEEVRLNFNGNKLTAAIDPCVDPITNLEIGAELDFGGFLTIAPVLDIDNTSPLNAALLTASNIAITDALNSAGTLQIDSLIGTGGVHAIDSLVAGGVGVGELLMTSFRL
ncbi:MAG: hypothetical protein AAGD00_04335 [Planctomycetota bacterium]